MATPFRGGLRLGRTWRPNLAVGGVSFQYRAVVSHTPEASEEAAAGVFYVLIAEMERSRAWSEASTKSISSDLRHEERGGEGRTAAQWRLVVPLKKAAREPRFTAEKFFLGRVRGRGAEACGGCFWLKITDRTGGGQFWLVAFPDPRRGSGPLGS